MDTSQGLILVVDDEPVSLKMLSALLGKASYQLLFQNRGEDVVKICGLRKPDLILLDLVMEGIDGFEVCRRLKADPYCVNIPVIIVSATDTQEQKIKAFQLGAIDFITKPYNQQEVLARVGTQMNLRAAQRQVERQYEELRRLEKMREEMVQMTIHDLRSPLHNIMITLKLMGEREGDDEFNELHRLASASAKAAANLTATFLDISRIESGRMPLLRQCCSPRELIDLAINELHIQFQIRGVRVISTPAAGREIECDRDLIGRVLINLLGNALKFSEPGKEVHVSSHDAEGGHLFIVRDEGPGIAEEAQKRIFQTYIQTEEGSQKPHSHGIGLAFCRLAMELHGGRIWVESHPGAGAAFSFLLPDRKKRSAHVGFPLS
jgi:two-component system, sensor histidine kinase and response regulator